MTNSQRYLNLEHSYMKLLLQDVTIADDKIFQNYINTLESLLDNFLELEQEDDLDSLSTIELMFDYQALQLSKYIKKLSNKVA